MNMYRYYVLPTTYNISSPQHVKMTMVLFNYSTASVRRYCLPPGYKSLPRSQSIRHFATNSKNEAASVDEADSATASSSSQQVSTLLYKANSSKARFPRGLFGFSIIHSGYWSWYVLDFTPALKTAAVDPSTIDSTVGYFGLGLSIFMSIGSMVYPKSLVSEISINEANRSLQVKTFTLPFVTPSKPVEYQVGDLVIDSPNDVTKILTQYNGMISGFPGHMALHAEGKHTNLLLNIKEDANEEIFDSKMLLQSLMPGQARGISSDKQSAFNGESSGGLKNDSKATLKLKKRKKRGLKSRL